MAQYSVYLVPTRSREDPNREAEERPIVSPVTGHDLEFSDAGVWLAREHGRNFFPYGQIRTIKEHPPGAESGRHED